MALAIHKAYPTAGLQLAGKVVEVAHSLGAHPFDLANVIEFESARSWRSDMRHPINGAIGLIKFYPQRTKQLLGLDVEQVVRMSAVKQMDCVQAYLDKVRAGRPLDDIHRLSMAVFFPDAIYWQAHTQFPAEVSATFPGIYTPADYINLIVANSKLSSPEGVPSSAPSQPQAAPSGQQGIWDQLSSLVGGLFGGQGAGQPSGSTAPPAAPQAVGNASWQSDPSLTVRLVSPTKETFGPGQVFPGNYQVEVWHGESWHLIAPVDVQPGRSYRVYVEAGGQLMWSEM